ncbi:hypothetical protein LIER_20186 [Lithospermum erythrorhizon]|uniref:Uncharacterized protein n=1 Tax=Lithospermum erythrorhizon TaxID=34254 RepID=A0AAV3QN43_LITER
MNLACFFSLFEASPSEGLLEGSEEEGGSSVRFTTGGEEEIEPDLTGTGEERKGRSVAEEEQGGSSAVIEGRGEQATYLTTFTFLKAIGLLPHMSAREIVLGGTVSFAASKLSPAQERDEDQLAEISSVKGNLFLSAFSRGTYTLGPCIHTPFKETPKGMLAILRYLPRYVAYKNIPPFNGAKRGEHPHVGNSEELAEKEQVRFYLNNFTNYLENSNIKPTQGTDLAKGTVKGYQQLIGKRR